MTDSPTIYTVRSLKGRKRLVSAKRGFTLAELLVVTGLMGIVLAGVTSSYMFFVKSSIGMGNYVDMNMQSRIGMETLGRELRMASKITSFSSTGMVLTVPIDSATNTRTVVYAYVSSTRKLMRKSSDGDLRPILQDVTSMEFKYYDLKDNLTTSEISVKKVQVEARMIRKVLAIENTNNVISARFLMRNRKITN